MKVGRRPFVRGYSADDDARVLLSIDVRLSIADVKTERTIIITFIIMNIKNKNKKS